MRRDPAELDDLFASQPEAVETLDELLARFQSDAEARRGGAGGPGRLSLDDDAKVVERLRHLGYLG